MTRSLSRRDAFILVKKHAEEVSRSSVDEDVVVFSPVEKTKVVFSPDVAVSFGKKSQDAANLKAELHSFENPQCFTIGKPYNKDSNPNPTVPYGHCVARNKDVMKKFIDLSKKDIGETFNFSITKGPCRMVVDLDAEVCDDPAKIEEYGHRLMALLVDYAGLSKDDPNRDKYMMTSRHRNGKGSVHLLHNRIHFQDPRHQASFMQSFLASKNKKIVAVLNEARKLVGAVVPKNKLAVGIFDVTIYGSPRGSPARKWNEDKRTIVYYNNRNDFSGLTHWDADPKSVHPDSVSVDTKKFSWGTLKRKANPFENEVHPSHTASNKKCQITAYSRFPKCFTEDYLPAIEKQLGGKAVVSPSCPFFSSSLFLLTSIGFLPQRPISGASSSATPPNDTISTWSTPANTKRHPGAARIRPKSTNPTAKKSSSTLSTRTSESTKKRQKRTLQESSLPASTSNASRDATQTIRNLFITTSQPKRHPIVPTASFAPPAL